MALLIRSLYGSSKKSLQYSYRMMHNSISYESIETQGNQDVSHDDDLPITLERNPYEKEKKKCILCKLNIEPDYKNVRMLSQFQSGFTGRIYGRHITGLCKSKQQKVEREILKAQTCGLMSIYHKDPHYLHDPKLFDPDHPFRPHKY